MEQITEQEQRPEYGDWMQSLQLRMRKLDAEDRVRKRLSG